MYRKYSLRILLRYILFKGLMKVLNYLRLLMLIKKRKNWGFYRNNRNKKDFILPYILKKLVHGQNTLDQGSDFLGRRRTLRCASGEDQLVWEDSAMLSKCYRPEMFQSSLT